MKLRSITLLLLCLSAFSCDKVKGLANRAKTAVENKVAEKSTASAGAAVDSSLQNLVDQTPEGVIFRKDLPFPNGIEVTSTLREELIGRIYQSSAIEKLAADKKGTKVVVIKLERAGDQVRYTLEQSSFTVLPAEGAPVPKEAPADQLKKITVASNPITYQKSPKGWRCSTSEGFRAAVISKELSPVFDDLLREYALAPHTLWLGKHRFKSGDQVPVSGSSLPMLLSGMVSGSLNLTFEKTESVQGHPCGVFSITGDFSRKQFPDFEGNLTDQDVTIESGKIWLSLIYPIILKQELSTIQTTKSGGHGGSTERVQGKIKVFLSRDWKTR